MGANKTFFKWVAKQLLPDSKLHKEMEEVQHEMVRLDFETS